MGRTHMIVTVLFIFVLFPKYNDILIENRKITSQPIYGALTGIAIAHWNFTIIILW